MNFRKLKDALTFLPRKVDREMEEALADKTGVATLAALQTLDTALPVLTTLLAGGTVKAEVTIRLVDTDGKSGVWTAEAAGLPMQRPMREDY